MITHDRQWYPFSCKNPRHHPGIGQEEAMLQPEASQPRAKQKSAVSIKLMH